MFITLAAPTTTIVIIIIIIIIKRQFVRRRNMSVDITRAVARVNMHAYNVFVCGPKFTKFFRPIADER